MPIREPAISTAPALSCSNHGRCTVRVMRGRAAAATGPTPIRTDPMRHGRCFAFSAIIPGRVLASLVVAMRLTGDAALAANSGKTGTRLPDGCVRRRAGDAVSAAPFLRHRRAALDDGNPSIIGTIAPSFVDSAGNP